MAAIVSGGSLGILQSSAALLGSHGQLGAAGHGRAGERVYLNAATGNLVIQGQDEIVIGRGPDGAFLRTYNSQGLIDDDNGDNWRLNFHRRVFGLTGTLNSAGSTITRADADGADAVYAYDATLGKYVTSEGAGAYDTLSHSASSWTFTDGDTGVVETYDAANGGRLTSVTDESGNALIFTYNGAGLLASVQTASGETTYLDYAGNNLTQIRTVASGGATLVRTSYAYDGSNRLTQVTTDLTPENTGDAKTYAVTYTYDGTSRRVASMTQSDGTSLAFAYVQVGADWRLASITDALSRVTGVSYDTGARTTTVTDALGRATVLAYDTSNRLTGITMPAVGGAGQQVSYAYDASGNVTSVTDAKGNAVVYGYDAKGNRVYERDADGNVVERLYGAKNELLAETQYTSPDPDGAGSGQPGGALTTRYVYDTATRLRFTVSAAGRVAEYRYNGFGQRVASIEYAASAYDLTGLGPTSALTEAQLTAWLPADRSASTRSDSAYDFRGQVSTVTTYAAVDAAGNGIAAGQSVTQFVYDQASNLLQTVDGRSFQTSYVYDGLGRVLATTDALGRLTATDYQDANGKTVITFANGLIRTSTYDDAGQLTSVAESAGGPTLGTTEYFYDGNGRLRRSEDPTGVKTHVLYDEAGRKIAEIDGTSALTEFRYDANDNLTRTIRYAIAVSASALASLTDGDVPQNVPLTSIRPAAHADDRSTWHAYDAADRLVKSVDERGFVTQRFYDGAGRVTDVVEFATAIGTSGLGDTPAAGSISPASSSADRLTRNFHDAQGKILATLDGEGYLVEYKYDTAGQLVETIAYATATNPSLRASGTLDELRPALAGGDVHSYKRYNARGQLMREIDGEGYLTEMVYDAAGNKTQQIRYAAKVTDRALSLSGAAGSLVSTPDSAAVSITGDLDIRVRLAAADWAPSSDQTLVAKMQSERSYRLDVAATTGRLTLLWTPDGTVASQLAASSTVAPAFSDGAEGWVRVTLDADNGAGGRTIKFYTSTDGVTWTQLGTTVTSAGTTSIHDNASILEIGSVLGGGGQRFNGKVYYAEVRNGIDGAVAAKFDPAIDVGSVGASSFASSTGEVWTLAGGASVDVVDSANAQVHSYTYDGLNRVASETNPEGTVSQYTYDEVGNLTKTVKAANTDDVRTLNAQYDKQGRLTAELSSVGSALLTGSQTQAEIDAIWTQYAIKHTYDAAGRRSSTKDALGNRTLFYYDNEGRLRYTINALGEVKRTTYNRFGQVSQTTLLSSRIAPATLNALAGGRVNTALNGAIAALPIPADNSSTSYAYDLSGNLRQLTDALGFVETLTYNAFDEVATRSQPIASGQTLDHTYAYDRRGLLTQTVWDPAGLNTSTVTQYDAFGRAVQTTDAKGNVRSASYDKLGRTVATLDPLNAARSSTYDAFGRVLTQTDALGKTTTFAYDTANRAVTMTTPEGVVSTVVRNRHGEELSVTDGRGNTTSYQYDSNGNLTRADSPAAGFTTRSYDGADRLIETVDARGVHTTYSYDAAGRTLTRTLDPGGLALTTRYVYDAKGQAVSVFDASGVETRTEFDLKGQAASVTVDPHGLALKTAYTYDRRGKTLTVIEGAGAAQARVTEYAYDKLGRRLSERVDPSGLNITTSYAYDKNDNVVSRTNANGFVTRYVYDANDRLVYTIDPLGAVARSDYDANGRVVGSASYANTVSVGALPAHPTPASVAALIAADAARDRITRVVRDDDGRAVYSINSLGAVTQSVYDANGNVVRRVAYANAVPASTASTEGAVQAALVANAQDPVARFFYDAANRPIYSIDAAGAVVHSAYDINGNVLRTRAYANVQVSGEVTLTQLEALLVTNAADRVTRKVYDAANRLAFTIDAGNYVKETRYDNAGRVTQTVAYANAVGVGATPTIAEVQAALGLTNLASYSNVTGTQNAAPVQPYAYLESARLDTATPSTQSVGVASQTATVTSIQPYTYIAAAKSDSATAATQNLSLTVQNTSITQSSNVANHSWARSGGSIYQTGGLSITPGAVGYADGTPTGVRATVYQNGSQISQIYTDVGYATTEGWSVYWYSYPVYYIPWYGIYHTEPTYGGESGYHAYDQPVYRTAYGTRWDGVSNWAGQVNISTGTLAAGQYSILLETWDHAQVGQAEGAFYDYADTTWGTYSNTITVNVGTVVNPTYVRWATSTQPAGTSTLTFGYRAAGSTGAYSTASVGVSGENHEANLGNLAAGNYEYVVEYRDSYNRLLKSASGTLASTAGQTTSASATFNYTTYASSAAAGSSIRYFTQASQWAPVDHVNATVKDGAGNVVATAVTYPEAESGYNGEVNLKTGSALASGLYTVELTIYNKDGSTTTVTPFAYEAGTATRLKQTISWASSSQPAGTTASFKYRPQGSSGSWASASIGNSGSDHQVVLDWLVAGNYEYAVEYRDSYNRIIKSAVGGFSAASSSTVDVDFGYTTYSSTASTGSSITGYIASELVASIERVEATVKTLAGATVSTAVTYPEFEPGYAGNVNLSVGKVLAGGRYNVTVTVFKKDGTSSSSTFLYELGPQDYAQRTTTVSWSAANQPAGTTVEFVYKRAGQSAETVVTPTLVSGTYSASFTFTADDGVQTGLAEGIYDFTVRYKDGATVVLEGKGQFSAQAGGGGTSVISFAPVAQQTETFAYDRAGRLIQNTDALGFSQSHAYDAAGNKSSNSDARGFTTSYFYDAAGRASVTVDAAGYVTQLTYDGEGRVIKEVHYANPLQGAVSADPLSQIVLDPAKDRVIRSVYDGAGRMRYGVDGEGYVTERRFDAFDQETSRVRYADKVTVGEGATLASLAALLPATVPASAALEEARFDVAGRVFELVDGEGGVTRTTYDLFGHKTEVTRAYGTSAASTTRYAYDILGRELEEIRAYGSADAATTRYTVDIFGNRTKIVEARGAELAETDTAWALATRKALGYVDGAGNGRLAAALTAVEQNALRNFYTTTQQFDVLGRRTRSTDPIGGVTDTAYDAFGNAVKVVDPRGHAGHFYFNQRNEAVLHVDPEGYATQTFYDAAGNVEKTVRYANKVSGAITPAQQPTIAADAARDQVTLNEYDGRDLRTRVIDAEGAEELYAYNAFGKKASHTNQLGGVTSYAYDRAGNLLSETLPVGGVVNKYEYDARGNRTRQIEAFGLPEARTTDFQFDKLDRQVSRTGQAVHVFDPLTNTATGTASPVEETRYDARGNAIETIAANGARTLTYYDALDRKIAEVGPLGALTVWQYNDGKAPIAELRYGDAVSLPAVAGGVPPAPVNATNVREKRFTYDANNALVETRVPSVLFGEQAEGASAYGSFVQDLLLKSIYDAAGNEVEAIDGRGNSTFRYYDKLGQKTLEVDAERYMTRWERDAAGNVVRETKYANKLTLTPTIASDVAALIANVSGGTGHRVTEHDHDRLGRVIERRVLGVETGSVATSNGALTPSTANARTQLQYNGLGQIVRQIDATGAVSDITYDAAGRKTREQGAEYVDFESATVRPTTDYEYDGLNQVTREIGRGKNAAAETDDRVTLYQYDYGFGARLIAQTGAHGTPIAASAGFAYDIAGRIASRSMVRTNADGASLTDRTNYSYDLLDREVLRQDLGTSQSNETRYNVYGELTGKRTNGGGAAAAWQEVAEYDKLGRVWKSNSGDGVTKVYLYDANGNSTLTIQSAGPDLSGMTLDQVIELPGSDKYLTVSQYDARNKLVDIYQPKMNAGHDFGSIEQFITQKAGVSFSGGAVSVGSIWGVTTKPTQTPAVPGTVAVSRATVQPATVTLRYSYGGSGTGLFNNPYSTLYVSVPDTSATLGTGNYHAVIYLNDIYGNGAVLPGIGTGHGITPHYYAGHSTDLAFHFSEWGSWPNNGFNPPFWRNYSYALYKQTPYGEVYLGSQSGTTSGAAEEPVYDESGNVIGSQFANWPNPYGNTNSVFTFGSNEVAFRGQSPEADRLILQYRVAGSGGGWSSTSVGKKFAGNTGWFAFDWSGWAHNTYEIRYTTLDASGNVLNSQDGTMVLNGSSPSISQSTRQIGGAGRAFMAADGKLHILEQGANAQTLTVRYRQAGSSAPLSSVTLSPASVGGAATPGWFIFDTAGLSGNYEFFVEAKDAGGAQLNKAVGTFTAGTANSVTFSAYQDLPEMVHFTAQHLSAVSMKVRYRLTGTQDWTTVWAEKVGNGAFDWNATGLVIDRFADYAYEFEYEAFDASNARVNKASGEIRVGISPAVITPHVNEIAPPEVRFSPPQAEARKLVLYYRDAGSSGTYATETLTRTSGTEAFVWNVDALLTPGTVRNFDYYYDLFDGTDAPLINPNGFEVRVEGAITVGNATPASELKWVVIGSANSDWSIHRQQAHNAFGEIATEVDGLGRVTDFRYNNLGLLVEKLDPETDITLANGFIQRGRPTTGYTYDLAGRLIAVRDANGNVNTQALLPGSGLDQAPKVLTEFHADGGRKLTVYDVFGDSRVLTDEIGRVTLQEYDKLGRLTRVVHASRAAGTPGNETGAPVAAVDEYAYDQAGNRIKRTNALGEVEKTYYDSQGRVTQATSFGGIATTYSYVYQSSIAGAGGVQVGGWLKTTTDGTGRTQKDKQDVFGRATWREDLGGHQFTYNYNHAGWLATQTGTSGQNIAYEYYANGYLKKINDLATGARSTYEYDAEGNRTLEAYSRVVGGTTEFYQHSVVAYDELNRVKHVLDPKYNIRYEYDANNNRRRVWSYYHDGIDGSPQVQDFWYLYDAMNRFTLTMGRLSSGVPATYDTDSLRGTSATDTSVSIIRGATGIEIGYDAASQRRMALHGSDGHREDYTYTADGYLEDTLISMDGNPANSVLRARRFNDTLGRVAKYQEYSVSASPTSGRTSQYDDDSKVTVQTEYTGAVGGTVASTTTYDYVDAASTNNNAGALALTSSVAGSTTTNTYYNYEYWDSAKERDITLQPYNEQAPGWKPGYSHFEYDVNGHLNALNDPMGLRVMRYVNDAQGQVMIRDEIGGGSANAQGVVTGGTNVNQHHSFYYLNGNRVGDLGNDGPLKVSYAESLARDKNISREERYRNWKPIASADFDQNYEPVSASYPGTAGTTYTVRAGDTLQAIARSVWGDASMWYLIADANGLTGTTALTAGQTLTIPNKITNIHNTSETYRVYNTGEAIGDTMPTLPDAPPPPPPPGGKGCGGMGMILLIVIIVVATIVTAGAAAVAMGATLASGAAASAASLGTLMTAGTAALTGGMAAGSIGLGIAAAAIGGAVGSMVGQGVMMAAGRQESFSWKQVAISAVGAGVGSGVGSVAGAAQSGWQAAATAMTANATTQGVSMAMGWQNKFDWRSVAVSGMAAYGGYEMGQFIQTDGVDGAGNLKPSTYAKEVGATTARNTSRLAAGVTSQVVRRAVYDEGRFDYAALAGSMIGQSLVEELEARGTAAAVQETRERDDADFGNDNRARALQAAFANPVGLTTDDAAPQTIGSFYDRHFGRGTSNAADRVWLRSAPEDDARALQDARSRIEALERTNSDLEKLIELRKQLADQPWEPSLDFQGTEEPQVSGSGLRLRAYVVPTENGPSITYGGVGFRPQVALGQGDFHDFMLGASGAVASAGWQPFAMTRDLLLTANEGVRSLTTGETPRDLQLWSGVGQASQQGLSTAQIVNGSVQRMIRLPDTVADAYSRGDFRLVGEGVADIGLLGTGALLGGSPASVRVPRLGTFAGNAPELPVAYGTPYRQLSRDARIELLEKVESRTATRDEWSRLQWNERLTERRQDGIDAFWAQERQNLTQGLPGTRNWSPEATQAILGGGTPRGIFGHHRYSVSQYPQLANDPATIAPLTFHEHFYKWHGGNWRNPTHGVPLRPNIPDSF